MVMGKSFLDMTQKSQATKAKIDKCDYIKLKTTVQLKRIKRQSIG